MGIVKTDGNQNQLYFYTFDKPDLYYLFLKLNAFIHSRVMNCMLITNSTCDLFYLFQTLIKMQ